MSSRPKYIYKIFPHSSVDTRFTFPTPIPASHNFFLSELDYQDGFVHLSAAAQVPRTLQRFFADTPAVVLLRLESERVGAWKRLSWDTVEGGEVFPHLHAQLEGENVDSVKEVHRRPGQGEKEMGWDAALEGQVKGWLV